MDTPLSNKERAYQTILEQLHKCTVEDSTHSAVIVMVDNKESTVKVYGLNLIEEEVPTILVEAAAHVQERYGLFIPTNRTLN
jgi:hypothetical protein